MNKQKKKTNKSQRSNNPPRKKDYVPLPNWLRIVIVVFSLALIVPFSWFAVRDNAVDNSEYLEIPATIKNTPKFDEYEIKTTKYKTITFRTNEYSKDFKISGASVKSSDVDAINREILKGDSVWIVIKKSEIGNLNTETLVNNYNDAFSIRKNMTTYVNLESRNQIEEHDAKFSFFFICLGVVILPYGLFKGKPKIGMDIAIGVVVVVGLVIVAISNIIFGTK